MACPLSSLREYNVNGKNIAEKGDYIVFGDNSWLASTSTSYVMYGSGQKGSPKEYYTLGSLLFLLQNERFAHAIYVKRAMSAGIPIVRRPDRRDLLSYLNGERGTSPSIDKLAPIIPPTKSSVKRVAEKVKSSDVAAAKKRRVEEEEVSVVAKRTKLDEAPREVTVLTDNIKSLSDAMSVERIAAIKAKRIARKRTTIKQSYNEDIENVDPVSNVDDDHTKEVLGRERHHRTRSTILQSNGKEFLTNVRNILKSVAAKESVGKTPIAVAKPKFPSPPKTILQVQLPEYNRYDQQRFVQQKTTSTEGFVIDTMNSYQGWSLKSVTEAKPASPPKVIAVPKRSSISRTPIIVVPSSESSLVTTYNAVDILQDLSFKTTAEKKSARHAKREDEVLLQRRKQGNLTVPYLVIDNPMKLRKEDWDRVVAVFVLGPQWQFKGWPYGGNPVEIFARIPAFHLKYDEMPVEQNVAKWAVKVVELSNTKRHLDRAAIGEIWEVIDRFAVREKPHLRF